MKADMMREEQLQQELASMYQFTEKRSAISGLLLSNATRDFSFAVLSFRRASNSIRISTLCGKGGPRLLSWRRLADIAGTLSCSKKRLLYEFRPILVVCSHDFPRGLGRSANGAWRILMRCELPGVLPDSL